MKRTSKQLSNIPNYQNGDYALYFVEDGVRGEWHPCLLDHQDLKWQEEKPKEFHRAHRPMPLDHKSASCLGFTKESTKGEDMTYREALYEICIHSKNKVFYFELQHSGATYELPLCFVHELQAMMRAIVGKSPQFNYKRYESIKRYQYDKDRFETNQHRS